MTYTEDSLKTYTEDSLKFGTIWRKNGTTDPDAGGERYIQFCVGDRVHTSSILTLGDPKREDVVITSMPISEFLTDWHKIYYTDLGTHTQVLIHDNCTL